MKLFNIFKNKIFIYLFTRYASYVLQFFLSITIAAKLGPFYLGVYGFVNLVLSYFSQINFGIPHALNVFIVHNKDDYQKRAVYLINAMVIYAVLAAIIIVLYLGYIFLGLDIGKEYNINLYLPMVVIIAVFTYFNALFTTVIRANNQVNVLSFIQTLPVVLNLCVVLFLKEEKLVLGLVGVQGFVALITVFISIKKKVFYCVSRNQIHLASQKELLTKGFYLFFYNSCFYFILISLRTIISKNYSVTEFGYFTFSFTFGNAVMLLLQSLDTIIFPKIIDLLSSDDKNKISATIERLRVGYISTSHFLIYIALLCYPVLVYIMPKYKAALPSMNLVALTVLMETNSYGYASFLIAQNKEKKSALISLVTLVVNILLSYFFIHAFHFNFYQITLATLISYFIFSCLVMITGTKILGNFSLLNFLKNVFPVRLLIPYISAIIVSLYANEMLIFIPLLLFVVLNLKDMFVLKNLVIQLIKNPACIDL